MPFRLDAAADTREKSAFHRKYFQNISTIILSDMLQGKKSLTFYWRSFMETVTRLEFFPSVSSGSLDLSECPVIEVLMEFLHGRPSPQFDVWQPDELVASHFVNPLRSLAAVRRFLDGQADCEMFQTPDQPHSEWCVLPYRDAEMRRAEKQLKTEHPSAHHGRLEYLLSKPSFEDGQWQHVFVPPESSPGEPTWVSASEDWQPEKSGLLLLLHDVCIGDDADRRLSRREMLRGLAGHCAGKSLRHLMEASPDAGAVRPGAFASLQRSPNGIQYLIYTASNPGPTHIFTELER